jgi:hypothetical protein
MPVLNIEQLPDYVKRTKVETIVSDSAMNQIVDDLSNSLSQYTSA